MRTGVWCESVWAPLPLGQSLGAQSACAKSSNGLAHPAHRIALTAKRCLSHSAESLHNRERLRDARFLDGAATADGTGITTGTPIGRDGKTPQYTWTYVHIYDFQNKRMSLCNHSKGAAGVTAQFQADPEWLFNTYCTAQGIQSLGRA